MRQYLLVAAALLATSAMAQMRITEWMYSGDEFIEFTNVGAAPIDMTGWSYDDDSQTPGAVDLSAFGIVAGGESVILAENPEATFRSAWSLPAVQKIIGDNLVNLGRNDEINLYDAGMQLVDRLTYGDQNFPGTVRTQDFSGNTDPANYGANNVAGWVLSFMGDSYGSFTSTGGHIGNPGAAPIPEPATVVALGLGLAALVRRRKK